MSSGVVNSCGICSNTVKGKQHYAICVKCSKRVHRKCYDNSLSESKWTRIRQTFACTACGAESRGRNESMDKPLDVSSYVPPTTVKYEIMIGASQKGGDIVSDICGYTYILKKDYPMLRVWSCAFRGCAKFPRCNSTLKQIKRLGFDFLRSYSQEDFTLNEDKAHSHPPLYGVDKRQLTVGQPSSTVTGTSLNLGNISIDEAVRFSADVDISIDYQDNHINNSQVETAKKKRCPDQRQTNKKQSIAFSIDELFGDNM